MVGGDDRLNQPKWRANPVFAFLTHGVKGALDLRRKKFYVPPMTVDLKKAVQEAGGYAAVAEKLTLATGERITKQLVWGWVNRATRGVPAERVISLASAIKIPRHLIRPDIYPDCCEN